MASVVPAVVLAAAFGAYLITTKNKNKKSSSKQVPVITEIIKIPIVQEMAKELEVNPVKITKTNKIFLYISVIFLIFAIIALAALNFVTPSKIIQKYNANNNDPNLIDNEIYNISIVLALFSSIGLILLCFVKFRGIITFGTIFTLILSALSIAKFDGNASITNYQFYVISICTLVFLVIGGGISLKKSNP